LLRRSWSFNQRLARFDLHGNRDLPPLRFAADSTDDFVDNLTALAGALVRNIGSDRSARDAVSQPSMSPSYLDGVTCAPSR
jgi:hypothetical protein